MTLQNEAGFDTKFFLGEMPEANYQQFVDRSSQPRERKRFFSNRFTDIQKEYHKALAGFAAQNPGKSPTTNPKLETFSDFLNNFSFEDKFFENAPWDRNNQDMRDFAPATKYRY